MTLAITGIYTSILAILTIWLGARVSIHRAKTGISIMHGDDMTLAEKIRQHGNLTEAVPIALILMGIVELNGASPVWLHTIGGILLLSRIIHPFGIKHDKPSEVARGIGSTGTSIAMVISMVFIVWTYSAG